MFSSKIRFTVLQKLTARIYLSRDESSDAPLAPLRYAMQKKHLLD